MFPLQADDSLSPEIQNPYRKILLDTLSYVKNIEDIPAQIDRLVKMIEGEEGFLGVIAGAFNYPLTGKTFADQINELGEKKFIPSDIVSDLHYVRKSYNITKHDPGTSKTLTLEDVELVRDHIVRIVSWYYCKCPNGPKMKSIFIPKKIGIVEVGHSRTHLAIAAISEKGVVDIIKSRTITSDDFFAARGFNAFCAVVGQLMENDHVEGLSIGVSAETGNDGVIRGFLVTCGWPERVLHELVGRFPRLTNKITVTNDAVAFAKGCSNLTFALPAIVLTMGKGVGCALIEKTDTGIQPRAIELGLLPITEAEHIHQYLGHEFFLHQAPGLDWQLVKVKNELSARFTHAVRRIGNEYEFKTVVVGGGRASLLNSHMINEELSQNGIAVLVHPEDDIVVRGLASQWHSVFHRKNN